MAQGRGSQPPSAANDHRARAVRLGSRWIPLGKACPRCPPFDSSLNARHCRRFGKPIRRRSSRTRRTSGSRATGEEVIENAVPVYRCPSRNGDVERVGETFVLRRLNRVPRSRQPTHACQEQGMPDLGAVPRHSVRFWSNISAAARRESSADLDQ